MVQDDVLDDDEKLKEEEKFLLLLDNSVDRARHFLDEYDSILTTAQKNKLNRVLESAQNVCDQENGNDAKREVFNMHSLMLRCGVPSTLDQASIAANQTNLDCANRIRQIARDLRQAAEAGNECNGQCFEVPGDT